METTKIIVAITKENISNESLCGDTSVVIKCIKDSIGIVGDVARLFTEVERFSFILTLLDRYSKNRVVCENIMFVFDMLFAYIKKGALGSETEKEPNELIRAGGIETINKVLNEQICERGVVLNCIYIFLCLSEFEGKCLFSFQLFSLYCFAYKTKQISVIYCVRKLILSSLRK